jgi:hypothetical protein
MCAGARCNVAQQLAEGLEVTAAQEMHRISDISDISTGKWSCPDATQSLVGAATAN